MRRSTGRAFQVERTADTTTGGEKARVREQGEAGVARVKGEGRRGER